MSTQEIERELRDVLTRHADEVMRRTDSQAEYKRLRAAADAQRPRHAIRLVVGGAIAAAAVTAVVVWSVTGRDEADLPPTTADPMTVEAANEAVAEGFVSAFVDGHLDRAATYLSPSLDFHGTGEGIIGFEGEWRRQLDRDAAWHAAYSVEPCDAKMEMQSGTWIKCPFDLDILHSEELGAGPFRNNTFSLKVKDGVVVWAEILYPAEANGLDDYTEEIFDWLESNHPAEVAFLRTYASEVPDSQWNDWLRLWEERSTEYAAQAGSSATG
jgi:hypothetical protein